MIERQDNNLHRSIPKILIPAAGFGRRVGSPEAKEVLPGPDGHPLIEWSLHQARRNACAVHVITRKEKVSLIEYLHGIERSWGLPIEIQLIESSQEWPDTLLQSEKYWNDTNLVLLPDAGFAPQEAVPAMLHDVREKYQFSFATFAVEELTSWGAVERIDGAHFAIAEKPEQPRAGAKAWGSFAFQARHGARLLQAQLQSRRNSAPGSWQMVEGSASEHALSWFKDWSREKSFNGR